MRDLLPVLRVLGMLMVMFALSMLLPLPVEDKQALLESPSLPQRRETLVTLIEFALRSGGANDEVMQ